VSRLGRPSLPWTIGIVVLWVVIVCIVTIWAIPVVAQPVGCGLQACPGPQRTTVEWSKSVASGVLVASAVIGLLAGIRARGSRRS